jgi:ribosomal protein L11 methylase PrmA
MIANQAADVIAAADEQNLRIVDRLEEDDWVALVAVPK